MAPIDIDLQLRYLDFDMNGHLNNVMFLGLLESARFHLPLQPPPSGRHAPGDTAGASIGQHFAGTRTLFVTDQYIEYRAPLDFRLTPISVRTWISRLGRSSFDIDYEIREPDGTRNYAIARTGMVVMDVATGRPAPLTANDRAAVAEILAEPLGFRRFSPPA